LGAGEGCHHFALGPALLLESVMDRGEAEELFLSELYGGDLEGDGDQFDDHHAAEDEQSNRDD